MPVVELEDRLVEIHGQVCKSDDPSLGITLEVELEVDLKSITRHLLRLFGRRPGRPGSRSFPLSKSVDVSLRLTEEGGPAAYPDCIAAFCIGAVVGIDDVLVPLR